LYIQGLVEGFYLQKTKDKKQKINFLRKDLENKSADELCKILYEIDPDKLEMVDKKNNHRLIRAIELAQEGLEPIKKKPDFEVLQIGIEVYRKELHERIDRRVDERFEAGMLEEVTGLLERGVSKEWLINLGLEYREITQYLADDSTDKSQEAMKQQLKYKIHQFARRQITWFKRFPEINWLGDFPEVKRFVKMYLEH
jgi:tRNA dimethylallyltransferase